ncbi:DNA/RNA polymerases superfamily protein [Quillaja saponaria]|uniref:DNA/RNA polymerases superfamily protein n=1 Tax=Quillaja saponaria TaxID=32244 RepID=A0AAD7PYN2_QUISA|nr:DNA/RNA polymerases superfamily protein [Quillaja saponaria]
MAVLGPNVISHTEGLDKVQRIVGDLVKLMGSLSYVTVVHSRVVRELQRCMADEVRFEVSLNGMLLVHIQVKSTLIEVAQAADSKVCAKKTKCGQYAISESRVDNEGVLRYQGRVVVPSDLELRKKILEATRYSSYDASWFF